MSRFAAQRVVPVLSERESPIFTLDDILPSDLMNDIGIDGTFSFGGDVIGKISHCPRVPRKIHTTELRPVIEERAPQKETKNTSLTCFEVRLSNDAVVFTFSIYECQNHNSCGVVVRDDAFLRYGRIIRKASQDECPKSTYQIVTFDVDGSLGRYIDQQTQIAKLTAQNIIDHFHINCRLLELEILSFRARSLMRIKVDNANADLDTLVEKLIHIFSIAVEIYE